MPQDKCVQCGGPLFYGNKVRFKGDLLCNRCYNERVPPRRRRKTFAERNPSKLASLSKTETAIREGTFVPSETKFQDLEVSRQQRREAKSIRSRQYRDPSTYYTIAAVLMPVGVLCLFLAHWLSRSVSPLAGGLLFMFAVIGPWGAGIGSFWAGFRLSRDRHKGKSR